MRIAIQGERGSFSHEAALRFGHELLDVEVEVVACSYSPEVFERVAMGEAGVIPIENSLAGSVLEHYDLLLANPVRVEAELLLRIRHCLIAARGVRLGSVRNVSSHPVALAQCRSFFAAHPGVRATPFYDTAGAVAHAVAAGAPEAAIASEYAAQEHGGEVLQAGIEDNPANYTRFLLLRSEASPRLAPVVPDKVSLAFAVPDTPGSLVAALEIFARHGLNLTRLESRPVPGSPWEYVFYTDYQIAAPADAEQPLAELAGLCLFVKELGRYRAAAPLGTSVPSGGILS